MLLFFTIKSLVMSDSKTAIALLERIEQLKALETRTLQETAWLLNAMIKAETRKLNAVFHYLNDRYNDRNLSPEIHDLIVTTLGNAAFPEYAAFIKLVTNDGAKSKTFWSYYEGIVCLVKLNKKLLLADKLARQGGTIVAAPAKTEAQADPLNLANTVATKETREAAKAQRAAKKAEKEAAAAVAALAAAANG